jgi:hypothetical protein
MKRISDSAQIILLNKFIVVNLKCDDLKIQNCYELDLQKYKQEAQLLSRVAISLCLAGRHTRLG